MDKSAKSGRVEESRLKSVGQRRNYMYVRVCEDTCALVE